MRAVSMAGRSDERAVELLDNAIARDPSFARAYAAKASFQFFLLSMDFGGAGLAAEIERTAARALALDPTLADAKGSAGRVHALHARWTEAKECFEAAAALDEPSSYSGAAYLVDLAVGHCAAAVRQMRKAFALAPAVPRISVDLAFCLQTAGREEESVDHIRIADELGFSADHPSMIIMRARAAADAGRWDQARAEILKLFPPDIRAGADEALARVYAGFADPSSQSDAAIAALAELHLERLATHPISTVYMWWYIRLGALDHAYAIAERILQEFESTGINVVGNLPMLWRTQLRAFRQDPRFQDLVRRLNFFPCWRRYGPPDGHTLDGDRLIVG
jgi:tetratricopeptide (TPR) repeat protein